MTGDGVRPVKGARAAGRREPGRSARRPTAWALAVGLASCEAGASQPSSARMDGPATADRAPACSEQTFEGDRFVTCGYDPQRDALEIAWTPAPRTLGGFARLERSLGPAAAARVRFAMNAGMYDPARRPVGLLVQAGRTEHPLDPGPGDGNFHLLPNGVFWTDAAGGAHVTEARRYASEQPAAAWATQSGPLLLEDGRLHPAVAQNGASVQIRNAVGACGGGAARFVISSDPVSFGRLARFMRDRLRCPDALYLDGAVSSLWAPVLRRRDPRSGLGPLVVVSARLSPSAAP